MVALVIVSTFVVLLLGILVAGLLRSHADILRSLHELGVGVGDPSTAPAVAAPVTLSTPASSPALGAAPAVAGVTPTGDARAVAVDNSDDLTLLGFLSSGCTGCAAFWDALQDPGRLQLPDRTRVVIVTKGPDREVPSEVRSQSDRPGPGGDVHRRLARLPGPRLTVLRPGRRRHRAQGRAGGGEPGRAAGRAGPAGRARPEPAARRGRGRGEGSLGGPAREAAADEVLAAAGILPGDPSLYPRTLDDVFPHGRAVPAE